MDKKKIIDYIKENNSTYSDADLAKLSYTELVMVKTKIELEKVNNEPIEK